MRKIKSYRGYSHNERLAVQRIINKAIKDGTINSPLDLPCEICGQTRGIREWHSWDYKPETALQTIQCVCWRCHRNWHIFERGPENKGYDRAVEYFRQVKRNGKIFPPVYNKNFYTKEDEAQRLKQNGGTNNGY